MYYFENWKSEKCCGSMLACIREQLSSTILLYLSTYATLPFSLEYYFKLYVL
jgi:hypothetical protein